MNRAVRRKQLKKAQKQGKQQFTLLDLQKALAIALEMKAYTKGHLLSETLKGRCVFCGKTKRTKTECEFWMLTYIDRVQTILINPDFFVGMDDKAFWLQHGNQYNEIKIPMRVVK